ncbi:MAG: putative GTPase KRas protein [Candidatus Thorarchaeota archaeon]|nr:MAG: putative GTPase KRas protein [Candidatus Thorarchaeota archaeon]
MSTSELKTKETEPETSRSLIERIKLHSGIRKILMAGSGAVGKSSLLTVLRERKSLKELLKDEAEYHRTLFVDLEVIPAADLVDEDIEGLCQMVDIAGQLNSPIHALKDISRTALGGVDVILLIFASDNIQSLIDLTEWVDLLTGYYVSQTRFDTPDFVLIRNKCDLNCSMDKGLIEAVLQSNPQIVSYFETSCLTGSGLDEVRQWLVNNLFTNR